MSEIRETPPSNSSPDPWREPASGKGSGIRIGAVIAVAAVIAFAVWFFAIRSTGSSTSSSTPAGAVPVRISLSGLTTLGSALTQPIYWSGSKTGDQYELTKANDGRVWIRYLPKSAKIGEQKTPYLTIGTYPVDSAYAVTRAAAKSGVRIPVGKGAVAFYASGRPTNVYLAYKGSAYQVEVFDPSGKAAQRLVATHRIQLIPGSTVASTHASETGAVALDQTQLVDRAKQAGLPIYWVGAKQGVSYELTQTSDRRSFIRYLPAGVKAGSSSLYLTIATYPWPNALAATKAAAKGPGVVKIPIAGGFAFYTTQHPDNVHIAYAGQDLQIEVFDPSSRQARRLVTSGKLVPVQ